MCCINGQIVEGFRCDPTPVNPTDVSGGEILAKSLSYVPTIAYCNMFSIFYLEIISLTKLVARKTNSDSQMGMKVNAVISTFYLSLFLLVIILQAISTNINNS